MNKKLVKIKELYKNLDNWNDKQVLVVGGTNGIGEGMAKRLAKTNANVTILGRNEQKGKDVVEQLKLIGKGIKIFLEKKTKS